jgi:glutamyl-tRNA reductase
VAVDLAVSIFGDLSDSVVLIVGAGEMAEQAAIHLRAAGVPEVVVVNRSSERGLVLANKVSGRYEPWERLEAELARADVVVTSTGSKLPVISRPTVRSVVKARRRRPLFFVDIAVPRDVEPDVGKLDHVFLYNVDDLQGIVHDNLRLRRGEAERADALVEQEVHGFLQWMRSRSIGPLMGKLQSHGRTIVDQEVERTLARLGEVPDAHRAVVEQMGRSIMQKLLHRPMTNVRKAVGEVRDGFDGASLAEALSTLFDLTETEIVEEIEASSETASRARASGAKAISSAKGASSSNGASGAKGAERLPQETRATAPDPPSIPRAEPS